MHTARHCEVEAESDVAWDGGMGFTACLTLSFWVFIFPMKSVPQN